MRYVPLNAKTRSIDTGNLHWNKKYLRGVQAILNVTRGSVMHGSEFFYQAFGENPLEFKIILLMPDQFIMNRLKENWRKIDDRNKRVMPYVRNWIDDFKSLEENEKMGLLDILKNNDYQSINIAYKNNTSKKLKGMLKYHCKVDDIVKKYKK